MLGDMQTRKSYADTGKENWLMSQIFIASWISSQAYQDSVCRQTFLVRLFLSRLGCEKEGGNSSYSSS